MAQRTGGLRAPQGHAAAQEEARAKLGHGNSGECRAASPELYQGGQRARGFAAGLDRHHVGQCNEGDEGRDGMGAELENCEHSGV